MYRFLSASYPRNFNVISMICSNTVGEGGRGSGGAMVLSKLPVPGRPANLDYSRTMASALAVGPGGVVWTFFLSSIVSLLSPSLRETTRYKLKYCFEWAAQTQQPTNHLTLCVT